MRLKILLGSFLIAFLVSCKTYDYKVEDKSSLAKLCVYEFPVADIELPEPKTDTIIKHHTRVVVDSVDCRESNKIEYVYLTIPNDTIYITRTEYRIDPMASARIRLIADLERQNNYLKLDFEKANKERNQQRNRSNRLLLLLIISAGAIITLIFKK